MAVLNRDDNAKALEAAARVVAARIESGRMPVGADVKEMTVDTAQRFLRFIESGE